MSETQQFGMVEALRARNMCQANEYMTREEATEQYLGQEWETAAYSDDPEQRRIAQQRAVAEAKARIAHGEALFAQGYRLHSSSRQIRGLGFDVPAEALESDVYPAGHIGTTEAERLYWITRRTD